MPSRPPARRIFVASAASCGNTYSSSRNQLRANVDNERKYQLRANVDFSPMKNMQFSRNTSYTNSLITQTPAGDNAQGVTLNAFRRDRSYFGNANADTIRLVYGQQLNSNIDRLLLGATTTWTPLERFSSRLTLGFDLSAPEAPLRLPGRCDGHHPEPDLAEQDHQPRLGQQLRNPDGRQLQGHAVGRLTVRQLAGG